MDVARKIDWWALLRYVLIGAGSALAASGPDQHGITQGDIENVAGAVVAVGTAIWGIYVKWNTAAVPIETAERRDIPVQSSLSGQITTGPGV